MIKELILLFGLMAFGVGAFMLAPEIHAWEVANNYPFGKLCEVFNNCK